MRSVFFSLAFFVSVPVSATHPYFSEIMANTADDATLEYFAIANPACEPFPLGGYSVVDASGKAFSLPSSVVLDPLGSFVFRRPESKIALNNENETLSLFDVSWSLVDSVAYETSAKGVPIVRDPFPEHSCPVPEASDSVSEDSGVTDSGSDFPDDSGQDRNVWPIADPEDVDAEGANGSPQTETVTETFPPSSSGGDSVPGDSDATQTGAEAPSSTTDGLAMTDAGQSYSWSAVLGIANSGLTASGASSFSGATGQSPSAPSAISALAPTAASFSSPVSTASSASSVSTSRAVAESLTLLDSNGDTAFDAVEIRYSEPVVWNPNPNEFLLYSKTWGLYERKVATSSWYFSTATVVGATLRLGFSWTTLPKTAFRVDASTSSEFRIKTASDMVSLKTVSSWLPAMPLALTTSFSGYSPERVSFVPAFPEAEGATDGSGSSDGGLDDGALGAAGLPNSESAISDSQEAGHSASRVSSDPDTVSNGGAIVPSESSNNSHAPSAAVKTANVPKGVSVVPSSWIDLLPDGKYRQVCFSKTCSPSFKVEWLPPKSKGYWQFSDGRKRYGNSTSTLGKKVPAEYRLSYVLELPEWTATIPVELSVLTEAQAETLFAQARTVNKSVAASAIGEISDSDVLGALDPVPVSEKTPPVKIAKPAPTPQGVPEAPSRRAVSVAVASAFVALATGAGFLAYRRRSWLPEETP